jgi:hypothetical protein
MRNDFEWQLENDIVVLAYLRQWAFSKLSFRDKLLSQDSQPRFEHGNS